MPAYPHAWLHARACMFNCILVGFVACMLCASVNMSPSCMRCWLLYTCANLPSSSCPGSLYSSVAFEAATAACTTSTPPSSLMRLCSVASNHLMLTSTQQPYSCTSTSLFAFIAASTTGMPPVVAISIWLALLNARFTRAAHPFCCTSACLLCAFIAASTTEMPPAAAIALLLSSLTARFHSTKQPSTCTSTYLLCAFIAASTKGMPTSLISFIHMC